MSLLTSVVQAALAKTSRATIDDLQVDAILTRTANFDSKVTDYPVEDGFPVADHVTRNPLTLSMEVVFTPTPVSLLGGYVKQVAARKLNQENVQNTALPEVARGLMRIYQKAEPITIKTIDAIYSNMVMTTCPLVRSAQDGICYKLSLEFKHVRIVRPKTNEQTTDEASGKSGETGRDVGTASQTEIGTGMQVISSEQTTIEEQLQANSRGVQTAIQGIRTGSPLIVAASIGNLATNGLANFKTVPLTVGGGIMGSRTETIGLGTKGADFSVGGGFSTKKEQTSYRAMLSCIKSLT